MSRFSLRRLSFFLLLVPLTGCAGSLNPLYESSKDLLEPKDYLGVWDSGKWAIRATKMDDREEPKERLMSIQVLEDPRMGRITSGMATPADAGADMIGGLVKINDQVFLDLTFAPQHQLLLTMPDLALPARLHMIQVHSFLKVQIKKDELILHGFDLEKLYKLLVKNPKVIAHKFIRGTPESDLSSLSPSWRKVPPRDEKEIGHTSPYGPSLLLTAESAELRTFLGKHANADIWNEKTIVFSRGNSDKFEKRWQKYSARIEDAKKRRTKDETPPPKLKLEGR